MSSGDNEENWNRLGIMMRDWQLLYMKWSKSHLGKVILGGGKLKEVTERAIWIYKGVPSRQWK